MGEAAQWLLEEHVIQTFTLCTRSSWKSLRNILDTRYEILKNPKTTKNISDVCHHVTSCYAILYLLVMRCNVTGCNAM